MPINAQGYLQHIRQYLNNIDYGKTSLAKERRRIRQNELVLSEKLETGNRRKVKLTFQGEAFAIRLDCSKVPLFHFLFNGQGMLWDKRCDFIVFHCYQDNLNVYCIEFKEASTRINNDQIMLQLEASKAWVKSLKGIVDAYANKNCTISISQYVFTACRNPLPDLEPSGRYLRKYPSIRHYLFTEVDGMALEDLENECADTLGL